MTDYNVHSTLFLKYLRVTWRILLFFALIISAHFMLLYFFPQHRRAATDFIWILSELLKIALAAAAFRKSIDYIKTAWLFIIVYGMLTLSAILIRFYYNFFYDVTNISFSGYLFGIGNMTLIIAFIYFSKSKEESFKTKRQLNLLGIMMISTIIIYLIINYNSLTYRNSIDALIKGTFAGVINISAFIIGIGIYWLGIWKKNNKIRVIYSFVLFSTFISFILNIFFISKKYFAGESVSGGYHDLMGTAAMLLIGFAAWNEVNIKERFIKSANHNLFYVSRIERIIPVLSLISMLAAMFFNLSKLDVTFIRTIIFLLVPYTIFLLFFELYSYRSEDAILSVLSVSPVGINITDRKFKKTYFVNESLLKMFRSSEIPPDIFTGKNISDELKQKILNSADENKILEKVEAILTRPDGTQFVGQCKIIPAKYYSYNVVITWIWDITDRKKYEGAILQQKYSAEFASRYKSELLNNLSNRMQSGYVTMRPDDKGWPDFVLTGMNKRILELFEFEYDLTGVDLRKIFPDPDPGLIRKLFEILSTGVSVKRELYFKEIDKIFLFLIFRASDDEVACLIDDITETKRKEKELVARERELSVLLGNLPGMVYRCKNDLDWTMLSVSEGSIELAGYRPEELIDGGIVQWNDLIHPEDRDKVFHEWQDALNRRESCNLDYRIVAKDLSVKYVWEKGLGVFDDNGDILFLEGFIFDITKQKEAEAVLHENEIKEEKIEKARALSQLAGGISHDLNNRLMGISSYTSLIEMKAKDQNFKKYTDGIHESVLKSTELIENLLIFARQTDIATDTFSVHAMLLEMILNAPAEFPDNVKVKSSFEASIDNVKGDYRQIYKAVNGILFNAKDAMPGGGEIIIKTENKTIDNTLLAELAEGNTKKIFMVIKISDSGIGIEKENLNRIFDPFYTTKPVGKGRGLGLSAVYGAIQAHKGGITVDSEPGKGTSFSIYLPVV